MKWLKSKFTFRISFILLVMFQLLFMYMKWQMNDIDATFKSFDSQFLYTSVEFYRQLGTYIPEVFQSYFQFQLYDFVFIIVYVIFFSSLVSLVQDRWAGVLVTLAVIAGSCDFIENLGLRYLLMEFPTRHYPMPEIIGFITIIKFLLLGIVFMSGLIRLILSKVNARRDS